MKNLIIKSVVKIVIAIILCALLSSALTIVMPIFGNDIAIGQLENDDISFMTIETWNRVQNSISWVQAIIWIVCLGNVGINTYKYFKNRKETN